MEGITVIASLFDSPEIREDYRRAFEECARGVTVEYTPAAPPTWRQRLAAWLHELAFRLDPLEWY